MRESCRKKKNKNVYKMCSVILAIVVSSMRTQRANREQEVTDLDIRKL